MIRKTYYRIKPYLPRELQILLRQYLIQVKKPFYAKVWPICPKSAQSPENWKGWPFNKKFALILTHDVDTEKGMRNCLDLMALEKELGFKSCFNFVPERYIVLSEIREALLNNGFEVGVHGLNHDGHLYDSKEIFSHRATKINKYLADWKAKGFRSPAMHHNLAWLHELNIEYDTSTFDTDPFEPQSDPAKTIFPFFVSSNNGHTGYVELPYTLPQDFTVFVLMKETTTRIWQSKLEWIAQNGGMVLLNTHPDYMNFCNGQDCDLEEYPVNLYANFLHHIKFEYKDQYWAALPKDVSAYCKQQMTQIQ